MKKLGLTLVTLLFLSTFGYTQEIEIVGTTSLGMQDNPEVSEENAYNDDVTNYWTGDPDTEPEVSITFDLACVSELTEIGINFWKADERTTTFSIAVAEDEAGPFTTIIDNETSAEMDVTVETEQMYSLDGASARYVKFIGIGNSSSTNWTSIANVNIYGADCGSVGIANDDLMDQGITMFPNPVTNGILNITSNTAELNSIEVYNVAGQKVLSADGFGAYSKQIDVTKLTSGTYFLIIEGVGQSKFVLR